MISFLCLLNYFLTTCEEADKTTNHVSFTNMNQLNRRCVRELEAIHLCSQANQFGTQTPVIN